ncbi:serine/threonine-protein kinase-like protein CR4 [Phalaenopsis equestris]|uniref:serine/threonine-protein kinase-like protein CR4 n=1 Tax=Phalaenopsis equestris TaxID=78828 RepID=UPI0009E371D0|nr:serine/threonine-protein kinase-like protein CR4 [Phalaenopsis equestris]
MDSIRNRLLTQAFAFSLSAAFLTIGISALGSMSSIAVSYGENGPVFCALVPDGSHLVRCFGTDASIVYGAPSRLPMLSLTAGDSFVCGLLLDSSQPYCWGNNFYVQMGVPQPMEEGAAYSEISAGDHHLCGVRKQHRRFQSSSSLIDCWGYNMTASLNFDGEVTSLTAGSLFNCALLVRNRTAFCWGDETGSNIISLTPKNLRYRSISAGGFHVCGILENSRVFCWGRSLAVQGDVDLAPVDPMLSVVGGRFHACGIKSVDHMVLCWGFWLQSGVPPPKSTKLYEIAAGDYFTCGVLADSSLAPLCWGTGGPWSIPMAASPGICNSNPCGPGFFEFTHLSLPNKFCRPVNSRVCLPCSNGCPEETYLLSSCNATLDRRCEFNCTHCVSNECSSFCLQKRSTSPNMSSLQIPIFISELVFGVVLVSSVTLVAFLYVRYKLQRCKCGANELKTSKNRPCSFQKELVKIQPDLEDLKIHRAQMFTFEELEKATGGFCEESQVGKGSFSCVFKGVLKDGTVVAVKRAIRASDLKKNSKEFHTELDLLSRLNHAHLLNLLGYCEEGGEMLLVYEFMAHGSLYQHLHGNEPGLKERLDWVKRVTIAVQAARGIEYLHGYACPPVIHRDIKSSNILIDEEHNARVSDFGLSLLGPTDSRSPLSELPAGTLGYLDPEYYRLHYLTTKSDVYSFGVLLLELLSGRKAIDMRFEEGNIVEWAVPLIKSENITAILDPVLKPPAEEEALKKIAIFACKCVRMRGKDRPSMDKVTTVLERALALLMGSPCNEQPILPTEVVLGSNRLHKKASQRSSTQSCSETEMMEGEDQRIEYRAPSWITFPSVTSSQRRKSSVSEGDVEAVKNGEGRSLRCLEEEIGPASPHEELFLQHNF